MHPNLLSAEACLEKTAKYQVTLEIVRNPPSETDILSFKPSHMMPHFKIKFPPLVQN